MEEATKRSEPATAAHGGAEKRFSAAYDCIL